MRKVLVITYEFPPAGGGGVQRWAKMCRYLPESGWTPFVLTAEPVARRSRDESLLAEVVGVEVRRIPHRHVAAAVAAAIEPAKRLARKVRGRSGTPAAPVGSAPAPRGVTRTPLSSRIARFIAVPDDAAFWRSSAVRAAEQLGREAGVDAVVATGPPFSSLVVGARVARRLGVPLILDMRDGWDTNPVVRMPTAFHRWLSNRIERKTLPVADLVTCTAPAIGEEARRFGARATRVIANGFDASDLPAHAPDSSGPLTLVFMGKVYAGHSDPAPLLTALARARELSDSEIRFEIVGSWPDGLEASIEAAGLSDEVVLTSYLPHREALERTARADVGVLLIADMPGAAGSCPAKLYEYLGMGMPVLIVGPDDGMPAAVLAETCGGSVIHPDDVEALARELVRLAELKAKGNVLSEPDGEAVARYSRQGQAAAMAAALSEVAGGESR
ncbi:MAG: glycosyltransferase [Coriobacteriia bacterium]|nr:glycosyltransferase [Coriobacteriia bacterium]